MKKQTRQGLGFSFIQGFQHTTHQSIYLSGKRAGCSSRAMRPPLLCSLRPLYVHQNPSRVSRAPQPAKPIPQSSKNEPPILRNSKNTKDKLQKNKHLGQKKERFEHTPVHESQYTLQCFHCHSSATILVSGTSTNSLRKQSIFVTQCKRVKGLVLGVRQLSQTGMHIQSKAFLIGQKELMQMRLGPA